MARVKSPKPQNLAITKEDTIVLQLAANQLWEEIGYDCLQALAEDKRTNINAVSMTRAEVIEMVVDASRLQEHLRLRSIRHREQFVKDQADRLIAFLKEAPHEQRDAILTAGFRHERYGM